MKDSAAHRSHLFLRQASEVCAMAESAAPLRIGLIGSTRGSSSQLTFDTIKKGELNAKIVVVISNKGDAGILERGRNEGVTLGLDF